MPCWARRFCQQQVSVHDFFGAIADSLPPERACTTVPSRLRHVSGQVEPILSIPWIEPYMECLEWIKAQELLNHYRHSSRPDRMTAQDSYESTLLGKIGAKDCPELKTETKGEDALDQVLITCSRLFSIFTDTRQDEIPQRSRSDMSRIWKGDRHGVP